MISPILALLLSGSVQTAIKERITPETAHLREMADNTGRPSVVEQSTAAPSEAFSSVFPVIYVAIRMNDWSRGNKPTIMIRTQ